MAKFQSDWALSSRFNERAVYNKVFANHYQRSVISTKHGLEHSRVFVLFFDWLTRKTKKRKPSEYSNEDLPQMTSHFFRLITVRRHETRVGTSRNLLQISSLFFQEINEIERASSKRPNPHKYLLYKPTLSQLHVFLACGVKVCILFILLRAKFTSLVIYFLAEFSLVNDISFN